MTDWKALALAAIVLVGTPPAAAAQRADVDLSRISLEDLLNITVVSASRKEEAASDVPAAVFVITREDIRRSGLTSLPELLRLAPGVQVAQINSSKAAVSIRGFNDLYANKLLVLVDGRSVYNRLFSGVLWDTEDVFLEDVERIEVIRGPGAVMWGANAVNGVVNIVTRQAADTAGVVSRVSVGSDGSRGAGVRYGGRVGSGHYRVHSQWSGFGETTSVGDTHRDAGDGWQRASAGARADWQGERDSFELLGNVVSTRARGLWLDPRAGAGASTTIDEVSDGAGAFALARWTRTAPAGGSLQFQTIVDGALRHEPAGDYGRRTIDVDFQYAGAPRRVHAFMFGGGYRSTAERLVGRYGYRMTPSSVTEGLASAFVQDELSLFSKRLRLTLGVKVEHEEHAGIGVQPSARAIWVVRPRQRIWAGVSRALRTPSLTDRFISVDYGAQPGPAGLPLAVRIEGGGEIEPEKYRSYEAGYRLDLGGTVSIDVTTFYARFGDLTGMRASEPSLSFTDAGPLVVAPMTMANLHDANSRGIEVASRWAVTRAWRIEAIYSALGVDGRAHATGAPSDVDGNAPSHQWALHAGGELARRVLIDVTLFRVGPLDAMQVPAYSRVDCRLELLLPRNLSMAIGGRNLSNRSHVEFADANGSVSATRVPRTAEITLSWRP